MYNNIEFEINNVGEKIPLKICICCWQPMWVSTINSNNF